MGIKHFQHVWRGRQWVDRPDGDDKDCQVDLLYDGAKAGLLDVFLGLFIHCLLRLFLFVRWVVQDHQSSIYSTMWPKQGCLIVVFICLFVWFNECLLHLFVRDTTFSMGHYCFWKTPHFFKVICLKQSRLSTFKTCVGIG